MEDRVLLDPRQLSELLKEGNVIPIDTRDPDSYKCGHIPGAVNAHDIFTYLATTTPEGQHELQHKFAAIFGHAGLGGKELGVLYEHSMDTGFGQSCRGYFLLKFLGYPRAAVLHGGFKAWVDAIGETLRGHEWLTPAFGEGQAARRGARDALRAQPGR